MNRRYFSALSWSGCFAALLAVAMLFSATSANASCAPSAKSGISPVFPFVGSNPTPGQSGGNVGQPATIVGLWHVFYTANHSTAGPLPVPVVPPGSFIFAETLKTWHSDGTEWEQLIAPPPAGGFCYGVWKHMTDGSVKLRHIGVIFAPDGSIALIFYDDEINRVSPDGMSYTGTFDFKFYAGTDIMGTGPVLQEISGTTSATRITVNGSGS